MGLAAAIGVGAGAIAVGTVGSTVIGANATKKASKAATNASQENNALAREVYGQNREILNPYTQRGDTAGQYLNAFYGLPTQQQQTQQYGGPVAQPFGGQQPYGTQAGGNWVDIPGVGQVQIPDFGQQPLPGVISGYGGGTFNTDGTQQTPVNNSVTQGDTQDAFRRYIQNSDYGFQFGEGENRVNSGYAGASVLQSGAAMKALEDYRQNLQSGYRNEWAGGLSNQQSVGLSAGGALAGVATNYANTVGANNNRAADAIGNAALANAGNNPFNALAGLGGTILGAKI